MNQKERKEEMRQIARKVAEEREDIDRVALSRDYSEGFETTNSESKKSKSEVSNRSLKNK